MITMQLITAAQDKELTEMWAGEYFPESIAQMLLTADNDLGITDAMLEDFRDQIQVGLRCIRCAGTKDLQDAGVPCIDCCVAEDDAR